MSNGNTLIGNALAGRGMDSKTNEDDTYLAAEEEVMEQAEDQLMDGEVTSEEEDKVEHQMLTAALVNSVVESSSKKPAGISEGGDKAGDDSKQRYSLRKRRRPSGEPSSAPGSPAKARAAITSSVNPPSPPTAATAKPPGAKVSAAKPSTTKPPIQAVTSPPSVKKAKGAASTKAVSPRARLKMEAVPAVIVAAPATPLPVPLPLHASALPMTSPLPPALQPPLRPKPPMPPTATTAVTNRTSRPKATAKSQQKRLAPAVRVQTPSKPLTPNPGVAGVPNPLSIPLPMSKSILVTKQKKSAHPGAPSAPQNSFNSGTRLTVPCPLPPSTFESDAEQKGSETMPPPPSVPGPESVVEKKKVTIAPEPESSRGRIFSIDLDPASLDFSVLDSGESGTPAPASADLPLVTGGSRDRAFSFECFAFGISADEPLPPLSEQSAATGGEAREQEMLELPRPRGDSIIFDPVSFQEGGIHEEHALTTRELRGLSVELDAIIMSSSAPGPPPSAMDVQGHPGATTKYAPVSATSTSSTRPTPAPVGSRPVPPKPHQHAPVHHYPEGVPSSVRAGNAPPRPPPPHPHHAHYVKPNHGHHHPHPHMVSSNPLPHEMHVNGAVAIIGSCATSTTLQMELLNKDGRIGIYLPEARRERIARFHAKRKMRIWRKRIKYDCRKKLADSRPRIKGRFVKRTDQD